MTRLEELLYSLTAVIVRYHDSQPKAKKLVVATDEALLREKSLICAKQIIHSQELHFKIRLNDLIKQCADSGRRPFLYYILHEITSLKAFLDKTASLEPKVLEEYTNQIAQLFIDLKQLLDTPKHKMYRITYSKMEDAKETSIALFGLKNDGYIGGDFCNSGEILSDGVLRRFNVSLHTSNEQIKEIAEQICTEHQNILLVPELINQNESQKKLNLEQKQQLNLLSTQKEENQKKLEENSKKLYVGLFSFYILFKRLQAKEEPQKKLIEQQQKTIEEMQHKINELTRQIDTKPNYRFYSPSF